MCICSCVVAYKLREPVEEIEVKILKVLHVNVSYVISDLFKEYLSFLSIGMVLKTEYSTPKTFSTERASFLSDLNIKNDLRMYCPAFRSQFSGLKWYRHDRILKREDKKKKARLPPGRNVSAILTSLIKLHFLQNLFDASRYIYDSKDLSRCRKDLLFQRSFKPAL